MKCCKNPQISHFDFKRGDNFSPKVEHLYCHQCKTHKLDGKFYTEAEWEEWINEPE